MSLKGYSLSFMLLCVIGLFAMLSTSLVNPLLSIFSKSLGASGATIGLSVIGYWVARVLLEIPSGFISAKYGYYWPMTLGLVFTALGTLWMAFVTDWIGLFFARALQGIGAPLFFAVSMTMVVNMFGSDKRGSAMGLFQGVEFGGTILGSSLSGIIITQYGFYGGFIISTVMCIFAVLLILAPQVRKDALALPKSKIPKITDITKVFSNKTLLIVSFATFAEFIMSNGVIYTMYPLYAKDSLGLSLTEIGLIQGVRSAGYVLALLTMGSISDRVGRKPVLIAGMASTAVIIVSLGYVSGIFPIAGFIFLLGATTGTIWIICPVLASESVAPEFRGAAIGVYRTFFDLGSIVGPIIIMWVLTVYGSIYCFYVASAFLIITLIPCFTLKETKSTKSNDLVH